MRRVSRVTRRERRAAAGPPRPSPAEIECVACGRELQDEAFSGDPPEAVVVRCEHGSSYAACARHEVEARHMVRRHDQTGQPVRSFRPIAL